MGKLSAVGAAFYGFGLIKRDPLTFLGCVILLAGFFIAGAALVLPGYISALETMLSADPNDPTAALAGMSSMFGALGLFYLLMIPVYAIVLAALNRSLIFGASRGWVLGLKIGMDEVRVILVTIVGCILVFLIYLGCVLVGAVLAGVVAGVSQNATAALVLIIPAYIIGIVLMIWVGVRLSVAGPASVGEGRFVIFQSWSMTKGRFWSLFLAYLLLYVVIFIIELVVFFVIAAVIGSTMNADTLAAMEDPEQLLAMLRGVTIGPVVIVSLALYSILATFVMSAFLGVAAKGYLAWKEARGGGAAAQF
jgi:hypothetical protein